MEKTLDHMANKEAVFWTCVYHRAAESDPQQQLNGGSFTPDSPSCTDRRQARKVVPNIPSRMKTHQGPSCLLTVLDSFVLRSILISWSEMPTSYRSCCKGESATRTGPSWAIRPWLWDLSTWQRWEEWSPAFKTESPPQKKKTESPRETPGPTSWAQQMIFPASWLGALFYFTSQFFYWKFRIYLFLSR